MDFEAVKDPLDQVDAFRQTAEEAGLALPESMTLATVSPEGRPHARVVLLKARKGRTLSFFTNYQSDKGRDLEANPFAELCIHYPSLALQARIAGSVTKVPEAESDAYFASRPRDSQIGAWASQQSRPLKSREELDAAFRKFELQFEGSEVARPGHWGGYALEAERVELWIGQQGRLHDRACYTFEDGVWRCSRMFP